VRFGTWALWGLSGRRGLGGSRGVAVRRGLAGRRGQASPHREPDPRGHTLGGYQTSPNATSIGEQDPTWPVHRAFGTLPAPPLAGAW